MAHGRDHHRRDPELGHACAGQRSCDGATRTASSGPRNMHCSRPRLQPGRSGYRNPVSNMQALNSVLILTRIRPGNTAGQDFYRGTFGRWAINSPAPAPALYREGSIHHARSAAPENPRTRARPNAGLRADGDSRVRWSAWPHRVPVNRRPSRQVPAFDPGRWRSVTFRGFAALLSMKRPNGGLALPRSVYEGSF